VVVVSLGLVPTAGFGLQVSELTRAGNTVNITVEISTPRSGLLRQVIANPFEVVAFSKSGRNLMLQATAYGGLPSPSFSLALPATVELTWGGLKTSFHAADEP
jgi:hypothetical protein